MDDSLLSTWLKNPLLVACSYFLLLLLHGILAKKSLSLRKQEYANHYIQEFYFLDPTLREIESTGSSVLPPVRVIRFWILRMIAVILLAISWVLFDVYGILLLRDLATLALGMYFCRQVWSLLILLNHITQFKDMIKHPEDVNGTIKYTNTFLYRQTRVTLVIPAILWSFIFLIAGHIFFLGGIVDVFVLDHVISNWEKKDEN
ncbi:MAG: hypothetical protein ACFFD4_10795 [Candidatus Odinarchaeota archaeon]